MSEAPNSENEKTPKSVKLGGQKLALSCALVALATFGGLDVGARYLANIDRFASPNRNFAYWVTQGFREREAPPDVVLMGSSLMLAVLNDGDATYHGRILDQVLHHRADYLEHVLKKDYDVSISTSSFAIGGQMCSDAYALARTLFKDNNKPRMIVWGIAPRDLLDATFSNVRSSETAHYLSQVSDDDIFEGAELPLWKRVEAEFGKLSYVYRQRAALAGMQVQTARRAVDATFGLEANNAKPLPVALSGELKRMAGEDASPGQWMTAPFGEKDQTFKDNSKEYFARYNPFKPASLTKQAGYLNKLLAFAKRENIQVVLVNMPLTQDNMNLMPTGAYDKYLAAVEQAAATNGATLIDFNQTGLFAKSDFADPVHLNGQGSLKFTEALAKQLKADTVKAIASRATQPPL